MHSTFLYTSSIIFCNYCELSTRTQLTFSKKMSSRIGGIRHLFILLSESIPLRLIQQNFIIEHFVYVFVCTMLSYWKELHLTLKFVLKHFLPFATLCLCMKRFKKFLFVFDLRYSTITNYKHKRYRVFGNAQKINSWSSLFTSRRKLTNAYKT